MKIVNYLLSFFAIVLLTGCLHAGEIRGDSLSDIKLGMSKQEIIKVLGKPKGISADDKSETYRYYMDNGNWTSDNYDFIFVNDKLKFFGNADTPNFKAKMEQMGK